MDERLENSLKSSNIELDLINNDEIKKMNNHNHIQNYNYQHSNGNCNNNGLNGNSRTNKFYQCKSEWVRLNIGGQYFLTTRTTLCKNAHSFFYKLCQDDLSIGLPTDKVNNLENKNKLCYF